MLTQNKTKIKRFIWASIKWLALNLFRTFIFLTAHALILIYHMLEFIIYLFHLIGKPFGINIECYTYGNEESNAADFTQKFSKEEVTDLAENIDPDATIQDIQDHLGISYRQARKIKLAAKDHKPLSINHYSWEDKIA